MIAPLASPARAGRVDTTKASGTGAGHRSTVPSTDGDPRFTGRDEELGAIEGKLRSGRVVVVHGPPGLGKSRLVMEYAHLHADAYPGGTFFVRCDQPPPNDLAKLLRDLGKPAYPDEPIEDQCRRALRELGSSGRTLLIYDAIADERTLRAWLPYDGLDWHLIATSTSASWARAWSTVELGPPPSTPPPRRPRRARSRTSSPGRSAPPWPACGGSLRRACEARDALIPPGGAVESGRDHGGVHTGFCAAVGRLTTRYTVLHSCAALDSSTSVTL